MDVLDAVLPVYVDYLGRFEVDPGYLETPDDVVRELMNRGVTDKRFLPGGEITINNGQIILRDNFERVIAERFPLRHVKNPVAYKSKNQDTSRRSGFSRLVIFEEENGGHYAGTSAFHAFQCLENPPEDLVDQIKAAKRSAMTYDRQFSKNSMDSNYMMNGEDMFRGASIRRGSPAFQSNGRGGLVGTPVAMPVITPAVIPTTMNSDPDRTLFLDKPRRQYETSDNPVEKNTILLNFCIEDIEKFCADVKLAAQDRSSASRLQEVQANDFVRIFQKFKLAFNLLAFLQGHIQDPDSGEILHHLFPPLAFLVDECYELFGDDLVRDVISPLPTRKAVRFLTSTLTEREHVIWRALGDYWGQPRSNWNGDIPSYRPIFQGGWSPGVINLPEDDDLPSTSLKRSDSDRVKPVEEQPARSIRTNFDDFRDELMAKKARIALVTFDRERMNMRELTVTKSEYLQVLDDERNWWKCKNSEGEVGFVPHTLLKAIIYTDKFGDFENSRRTAQRTDVDQPSSRRPPSPTPSLPPPAPPMPVVAAVIETAPEERRQPRMISRSDSSKEMQEELKSVLEIYRDKQEKLNILTTPDIYITQNSTPMEVRNWLQAKHFSQRVIDQMAGMHGGNLFAMSRKELVAAFGQTEGKRLDSQITISRNTAGFKTARSSELKEVLEKARKRSDKPKHDDSKADNSDIDDEEHKDHHFSNA